MKKLHGILSEFIVKPDSTDPKLTRSTCTVIPLESLDYWLILDVPLSTHRKG